MFYPIPLTTVYDSESLNVIPVAIVSTRKEGRRCGRPQKTISREFLSEAFRPGRNISLSKVAEAIGVDRKTLSAQMKIQGIVQTPFSTISDENLDVLVKDHKTKHPNAGIRYIRGSLHAKNLRVQRHRVISSLSRVDTVTVVSHRNMEIMRRDYHNPHPNAMWHLDGHHKLGPWGIVIHGITDGYDRVVSFIILFYTHKLTHFRSLACNRLRRTRLKGFCRSFSKRLIDGGALAVHVEIVVVKMLTCQHG